MKTIYKYELQMQTREACFLDLPRGAEILSVQMQREIPCMWALVDTDLDTEKRELRIFGTGTEVPDESLKFVDTFQASMRHLVFHVFEVVK